MTTQEEIEQIMNRRGHNSPSVVAIKRMMKDEFLRNKVSDEYYLEFLRKQEKENPRPIYNFKTNKP